MQKDKITKYEDKYILGIDSHGNPVTWDFMPPHGMVSSEKEEKSDNLVNSIVQQALDNKQTKVFGVDLGQKNMSRISNDKNKDRLEVATAIEEAELIANHVSSIMFSRYETMENLGINNYANIDEDYHVILFVVNNSQKIGESSGKLQEVMGNVARLGRAANIFLLFNSYNLDPDYAVTGEVVANMGLRIQLGKTNHKTAVYHPQNYPLDREKRTLVSWKKNGFSLVQENHLPITTEEILKKIVESPELCVVYQIGFRERVNLAAMNHDHYVNSIGFTNSLTVLRFIHETMAKRYNLLKNGKAEIFTEPSENQKAIHLHIEEIEYFTALCYRKDEISRLEDEMRIEITELISEIASKGQNLGIFVSISGDAGTKTPNIIRSEMRQTSPTYDELITAEKQRIRDNNTHQMKINEIFSNENGAIMNNFDEFQLFYLANSQD